MPTLRVMLVLPALLALPGVGVAAQGPSQKGKWEQIDDDEGIKVWQNEVPGSDLPGFRGEVVVAAEPQTIVDVIEDWKHHTEWMQRCAESTLLKRFEDGRSLIYNRTSAPWPVWDRDVILETKLERSEDGKTTTLNFHSVSSDLRKLPEKVVRMPRLTGFYKLVWLGDKKTKITYQVEADPGGSLPRWVAKRVVRDLPFETLSRLRDRVGKAGK